MNIIEKIKNQVRPSSDYIFKTLKVDRREVEIIFNEVLTDSKGINDYILDGIVNLKRKELENLQNKITTCNVLIIDEKQILNYLNNGFVIVIYKKIYAFEIRANLDRGITTIESELSISGPKDSFTETFNTNLGLIRRRIKSEKLKALSFNVDEFIF